VARLRAEASSRLVIVATHDPAVLDAADRVLELVDGRLVERRSSPVEPRTAQRSNRPTVGILRLAWDLTRGRRGAAVAAAVAAGITLAVVLSLLGLTRGGTDFLVERVLGRLPTGMVRVVPPRLSLGPIELEIGSSRLGEDTLADLRALPGVRAAHPQRFADFPVALSISFLGRGLRTDAAFEGLTAEWLDEDVDPDRFSWKPGEPIPAVVSEQLISMFNSGFGSSQGLPRIKASALKGLTIDATLGRSSFGRVPGPPERATVRVVGISRRVSPIALAVPMDVVRHYSRVFNERRGRPPSSAYSSVVLELGDAEATLGLEDAVVDLGLRLEDDAGPAAMLARAILLLRRAGGAAGAVLMGMAAVLLGLVLRGRFALVAPDIDVLEFVGVPRRTLLGATIVDVLAVSGMGCLLGLAGVAVLSWGLEDALRGWVREATGLRARGLFRLGAADVLTVVGLPLIAVALTLPAAIARLRRPLLDRLQTR
jgi:hypothetical protein